MEYTIQKLASLGGVSTKTLRYYHDICLLYPKRISSNGYRIYGEKEVKRLQKILFFKRLNFPLEKIKILLEGDEQAMLSIFQTHLQKMLQEQKEMNLLIENMFLTIKELKGEYTMLDSQRFYGLKRESVEKNESSYGKEIREKYGNELVQESNEKILNLSLQEWEDKEKLEEKIFTCLRELKEQDNVEGDKGKSLFLAHQQWLKLHTNAYSISYHRGLAELYLQDDRFSAYYDEKVEGGAQILQDTILYHARG